MGSWAAVKEALLEYLARRPRAMPMEDPTLLRIAMQIQRYEPDVCVLGVIAIFGLLDSLATPEYRDWFRSAESRNYFPERKASPTCELPAARSLLAEIEKGRTDWE